MLTLNDGRSELWQWDTGREISVDTECSQVHFSKKVFGRSVDVDVVNGVAAIPDFLLQTDKELEVWAFVGAADDGYTKISKTFKVNKRNKPAEYVFTPTEQTTLEKVVESANKVIKIAEDSAENAELSAKKAIKSAELAQSAVGKTSYIGENGNWFEWDADSESFVDTGIRAQGAQGIQGERGEVNIDDESIGSEAWSSKNIVDRLCPPLFESGGTVRCNPVEGYPLSVVTELPASEEGYTDLTLWRGGKNLINPTEYMRSSYRTTLDGDVFTSEFIDSALYVNTIKNKAKTHQKGTYTLSVIPVTPNTVVNIFVYSANSGDELVFKYNAGAATALSFTFTANEDFYVSIGGASANYRGTYSYKLQLEVGTAATEYELYRGEYFSVEFEDNVYGGSYDWTNGVLTDENGETTQLTPKKIPSLDGVNTFSSKNGETIVEGRSDLSAIIEKLTNVVDSLIGTK